MHTKHMALGALVVLGGCASGNHDDLTDTAQARTWATTASALGVYAQINDAVAVADGRSPFPDAACPTIETHGQTTTITGGCTDTQSAVRHGSVTIDRAASGTLTLTFADYGHDDVTANGTATLESITNGRSFDVSLQTDGLGTITTYTYSGTVVGDYDRATFDGTGEIERTGGFNDPMGAVAAATVAELHDGSVCNSAPASGTTTLRAGGHTVVITYDGATDCDDAHRARWTVDDVDRGLIDGIQCSVTPGAARGSFVSLAGIVIAGVVLARRRRS